MAPVCSLHQISVQFIGLRSGMQKGSNPRAKKKRRRNPNGTCLWVHAVRDEHRSFTLIHRFSFGYIWLQRLLYLHRVEEIYYILAKGDNRVPAHVILRRVGSSSSPSRRLGSEMRTQPWKQLSCHSWYSICVHRAEPQPLLRTSSRITVSMFFDSTYNKVWNWFWLIINYRISECPIFRMYWSFFCSISYHIIICFVLVVAWSMFLLFILRSYLRF